MIEESNHVFSLTLEQRNFSRRIGTLETLDEPKVNCVSSTTSSFEQAKTIEYAQMVSVLVLRRNRIII